MNCARPTMRRHSASIAALVVSALSMAWWATAPALAARAVIAPPVAPVTPVTPPGNPAATPAPPAATPAPPAAAPVPPAAAPAASPAAPVAAPVNPTRAFAPEAFARAVDSLHDVKPTTKLVARLPATIRRATIDLGAEAALLSLRARPDAVELIGVDAQGKPATLGVLRWDGSALQWAWMRASVGLYGPALTQADALLPGALIEVTLTNGATERLGAPAQSLLISMQRAAVASVVVPALSARALTLVLDGEPGAWVLESGAQPDEWLLSGTAGQVRLQLDSARGVLNAQVTEQIGIELRQARDKVLQYRRELQRRTDEERTIILAQIDALTQRIRDLEVEARAPKAPLTDLPKVRLQDASGRVFAKLELQSR